MTLDQAREEYQHALRSTYVDRGEPDVGRTYYLVDEDKADALIAALVAELERVKTGVVQTHMYRLPVLAIEVETGEQGVHWIDGLSAAEVFAVLRDDVPAPVYESISGLHALVADLRAQAEKEAERG